MKICLKSMLLTALLITVAATQIEAKDNKNDEKPNLKKILILGLKDNIKSDYYYKELIAEESGIPQDSLEVVFNRTIAGNITQSHGGFVQAGNTEKCNNILNNITVTGEQDECTTDLSQVDSQCFRDLLSGTGAEYVLILSRHFLRKQDQPFNTVFYFVSYSLFNKEKKEISRGSNYFTTMHLETAEVMKKNSRKTSDKIATTVLKLIEQQSTESSNVLLSKN